MTTSDWAVIGTPAMKGRWMGGTSPSMPMSAAKRAMRTSARVSRGAALLIWSSSRGIARVMPRKAAGIKSLGHAVREAQGLDQEARQEGEPGRRGLRARQASVRACQEARSTGTKRSTSATASASRRGSSPSRRNGLASHSRTSIMS